MTLGGLAFTQNLYQKNKETLFLSSESIHDYLEFKESFNEQDVLIIKKEISTESDIASYNQEVEKIRNFCDENLDESCQVLSYKDIPKDLYHLFNLKGDHHLGLVITSDSLKERTRELLTFIFNRPFFQDKTSFAGVPYTNYLLDHYSKDIQEKLFPTLFTVVFIFLIFFLKSFQESIIIFLAGLLATSLSLSSIKIFYTYNNLVISIVPLLMFVINLSLALHLFHTIKELGTFKKALHEKKKPIILMVFTTFIGFLSLMTSDLAVIRDFGLLTSSLMLITSGLTIIFMYSSSLFITSKEISHPKLLERLLPKKILSLKQITLLSLFSLCVAIISFPKIPVITDATQYFPKSTHIRENIIDVTQSVSGVPILDIILKPTNSSEGMEQLNDILKFEDELIAKENLNLLSNNQLIRKINYSYSKNNELPKIKLAYLSLRSKLPLNLQEGYPVEDQYRVTLLGSPFNVHIYEKMIKKIEALLTKHQFQNYQFNGLYYHLMTAQKKMIATLFKSFLLSLFIISVVAFIHFRVFKVFWVFLFVNIIPVCLSFGLFKLFSLSFNIATVMTYSISLGLIVDGSFHVLHGLHHDSPFTHFYKETISKPIFIGSLILALAFMGFAFNGFLPIRQFGISLSLIIFIGMIFDLMILPAFFMTHLKAKKGD